MIPTTIDRVPRHTSEDINRRIRHETEEQVRHFAANPAGINRRLHEVAEEWNIERILEANASTLAFTGILLGATVYKRRLALPALVTTFLFQHAIQSWCPPIPILRRLGYRTSCEIDTERVALKALRGDFGPIGPDQADRDSRTSHALQAARL